MARGFRASESAAAQQPSSSSPIQAAFEKKAATMKSKPSAATVSKFLRENADKPEFRKEMLNMAGFIQNMYYWQRDSGNVDRQELISQFKAMPDFVKSALSDDPSSLKKLWRGDEVINGKDLAKPDSDHSIKAFTSSPGMALFFGHAAFTADDVQAVEGIINTAKVGYVFSRDVLDVMNEQFEDEMGGVDAIGDDEGEHIVFGLKWKPGTGSPEWAKDTQPARYAAIREASEKSDPKSFKRDLDNSIIDKNGRMRWTDENGNNREPGDRTKGMQLYDPETKIRIRPPVELVLKDEMPHVFGKMTPEEQAVFNNLDRRG